MKKGFILFLSIAALSLPSLADTYSGSDKACFYASPKSSCTPTKSESTIGGSIPDGYFLSYKPDSSFSAPFPGGGTVDLGTFNAADGLIGAADGTFDIDITFKSPAGAGGNTYTADAWGYVLFGYGGAEITFDDPTTQLYTYPGGEFDLTLPNSIWIDAGCNQQLDATITPVPEPASLGAFGGGLVLLGLKFGRNRRKNRRETTAS